MTDTLFVFIMDLTTFAFFSHPKRSEGGLQGMENGTRSLDSWGHVSGAFFVSTL